MPGASTPAATATGCGSGPRRPRKPSPRRRRKPRPRALARVKLSYKEARELESLPAEIKALEAEQAAIEARRHAPEYSGQPAETLRADQARIEEIEAALLAKLERWEALESKARASSASAG